MRVIDTGGKKFSAEPVGTALVASLWDDYVEPDLRHKHEEAEISSPVDQLVSLADKTAEHNN